MYLNQVVRKGKKFSLANHCGWYVNENGKIYKDGILVILTVEEMLSDKWKVEEAKEEWFEGEFRKKYPNGVVCKVSGDYFHTNSKNDIVVDYIRGNSYPFKTISGGWEYAKPVSLKEAPAIIGEED